MSKPNSKALNAVSSIEALGARLQKVINTPAAQQARAAVIYKAPDESQEDWDQIIEAIVQTDGVYVTFQDDGSTRVHWDVPSND